MKHLLLIAALFIILTTNAQDRPDPHLIVYHTYEDFKSDIGDDLGKIVGRSNDSWGGNKLSVKSGKKTKKINLNQFWGFRIGDYLFRMNTYSLRIPLTVLGGKEKVFYIDGNMMLDKAIWDQDSGKTFRESDGCFYSDDMNSEVFEITEMIKNEKNNPNLQEMIECIKDAKDRLGIQSKFNGYVECLQL